MQAALPPQVPECGSYLDVLGEAVEHLFSYRHGFGEVSLSLLLNDILARVVPVEVADGFLWAREGTEDAGAMIRSVPRAPGSGPMRPVTLPHL